MKKFMHLLLASTLVVSQFTFITKANETSNDDMFDRWHYRTETENGKYSYGEDHPNAYDLPIAYDARKEGIVTSVKNQGKFGMCWAFGIISAMETNILKKGLSDDPQIDLSEAHLGYFDSATKSSPMQLNPEDAIIPKNDYTFLDSGASALLSTLALSKGVGPVYEERAPFYPYSSSFVDLIPRDSNFEREFYLKDAAFPNMSDTEGVKRALLSSGAISMAYTASSSNYTDQYYVGYGLSNHIVSVVGYDDTIKKENFDLDVDVDGAWIVKNSWGETGNGGYFYLSYDASSLEIVAPNVVNKDVYDYNYFYDASDSFEEKYSYQGEPVVLANVYEGQNATTEEKEMLHSVGILMPGCNTNYELQIYMDPEEGNPTSGTPYFKEPIKGNKVFRGYYTICLPESIEIEKGQKFSVVFKLQNRNLNYETMYYLHDSIEGIYSTIIEQTMPNQSFRKLSENSGWEDLHDISRCVAIRALTSMKDQDYKPSKTLDPNDFSLNQTDFTFTNDAIEPIVNFHNDSLEEMMDYAIAYENNINLGTGKVIIYGMNDYEGSKVELPFTIHKAKLQQRFFRPIEFQLETGSQLKPQETIYYYDLLLEEGKDYTITYGANLKDNESDNEGSITLTGIGNFEGQVTMNFNIVNPKRMVSNTISIEPANVGSASTASQARIGEEVKAVAGYLDYDYAFVGWYVDDILYSKDHELTFVAKDNLHLVAKYVKKKTIQELIQLVDDVDEFALEHLNDPKCATFIKEFNDAESILVNGEQDSVKITRAYIFLQKAYDSIDKELDYTKANQILISVNQLEEKDYTFVSWGQLALKVEILENAINDYDVTQEKLDEIVTIVENAQKELVKLNGDSDSVNKKNLIKLYESKLTLNKDDYTSTSYALLQTELNKAKAVIDDENVSQEEVDTAYEQLFNVALVQKGDKTLLSALIKECQQLNKDLYTDSSYQLLQTKLQEAILVESSEDADQVLVNEAYYFLKEAKDALEQVNGVSKETLQREYDLHKDKNEMDYTSETWVEFNAAFHEAKKVLDDENVTQEEVDQALLLLQAKAKALEMKPQETVVNKDALVKVIADAKAVDTTKYTEATVTVLTTALTAAESINVDKKATQEAVDAAVKALTDAIDSLEEKPATPQPEPKPTMDFYDVQDKSAWFYGSVEKAFQKGLMLATGKAPVDGKPWFEPDTNISRGMVATVLYRMAGQPKVEFKATFKDVTNANLWYSTAITWAAQNNVVSGYKDGRFGCDDNITRQDLAIMLRNYAKSAGLDTNVTVDFAAFKDGKQVVDYAASAIAWCVEAKLMSGSVKADGTYLMPTANATRAECAKMFSLLDDAIKANAK